MADAFGLTFSSGTELKTHRSVSVDPMRLQWSADRSWAYADDATHYQNGTLIDTSTCQRAGNFAGGNLLHPNGDCILTMSSGESVVVYPIDRSRKKARAASTGFEHHLPKERAVRLPPFALNGGGEVIAEDAAPRFSFDDMGRFLVCLEGGVWSGDLSNPTVDDLELDWVLPLRVPRGTHLSLSLSGGRGVAILYLPVEAKVSPLECHPRDTLPRFLEVFTPESLGEATADFLRTLEVVVSSDERFAEPLRALQALIVFATDSSRGYFGWDRERSSANEPEVCFVELGSGSPHLDDILTRFEGGLRSVLSHYCPHGFPEGAGTQWQPELPR